jgi:hypothetical protein
MKWIIQTALAMLAFGIISTSFVYAQTSNHVVIKQISTSHSEATVEMVGDNNRAFVSQGERPTAHRAKRQLELNQSQAMFQIHEAASLKQSNDPLTNGADPISPQNTSLQDLLRLGTNDGASRNNKSTVVQRGLDNRTLAVQNGVNNTLRTEQRGNNNVGIHIQRGDNNATELIQDGDSNRNALVATGGAHGNGGPFTLKVDGSNVADGLAVQVEGRKTFGGFKVTPNGTGGFNMTPMQHSQ